MSAGISDVDVCNYAYEGQLALLQHKFREDKTSLFNIDQVQKIIFVLCNFNTCKLVKKNTFLSKNIYGCRGESKSDVFPP